MFVGAKEHGELTGLKFAGELTREDLLFLHAALRIPKEHEPYRCHCFGDVTIELIGDSGRVAILALHYHRKPLLSHSGWSYDAELGSRSALLAFLSNFKVLSGLKEWEKELQESEAEQKRQGVRMWINSGGIPLGDAMMRASKEQPG